MKSHRRLLFVWIATTVVAMTCTGCTAGYRYASYDAAVPSPDGEVRLVAQEKMSQLGATLDFRYFRALIYGELGSLDGDAIDERGRLDRLREKRSGYWFGLDVPLLTIWNFDGGGCCTYPGLVKKRHALELWASAALMPARSQFVGEMALVYYFTRFIGAKLSGGVSTVRFSANTNGLDGTRRFDDIAVAGSTFAISIVIPAGPWGISILEELIFWDEQHRDQHGGY